MTFKSLMFLSTPAPLPRRVRGRDYAGVRGGYGPRYARAARPEPALRAPVVDDIAVLPAWPLTRILAACPSDDLPRVA